MIIDEVLKKLTQEISDALEFEFDKIKNALSISNKSAEHDFILTVPKFAKEDPSSFLVKINKIKNIEAKINGPNILIKLNKEGLLTPILIEILNSDYKWNFGLNKNVIVEYSSPNIAKIFHVGHLRTTVLGNFIKLIYKKYGYNTISINYLGDYGKQFGLIGVGYEKYGNEEELEKDPLKHLFNIYVKISEDAKNDKLVDEKAKAFFREMENQNEENLALWRKFREISIKKYKETYKKLGVEFDIYSGESFYGEKGKKILEESKVVETQEDGSKVIKLDNNTNFIVLKSDGGTMYQTRDIAAAFERQQMFNPEKIIYVVASEQSSYFCSLKQAISKLGMVDNLLHVEYGLVLGMSTRKGTVIFLEDVIDQTKEAMINVMKQNIEKFDKIENLDETATILAVSGIIIQDFSAKRIKDYKFDISRCVSIEGSTGPYLQYTHCRLFSIQETNSNICELLNDKTNYQNIKFEDNNTIDSLLFLLSQYKIILDQCLLRHEPHSLVEFLMKICKQANFLIGNLRVKNEKEELAVARMALFMAIRKVLADGMEVLGIKPLQRM